MHDITRTSAAASGRTVSGMARRAGSGGYTYGRPDAVSSASGRGTGSLRRACFCRSVERPKVDRGRPVPDRARKDDREGRGRKDATERHRGEPAEPPRPGAACMRAWASRVRAHARAGAVSRSRVARDRSATTRIARDDRRDERLEPLRVPGLRADPEQDRQQPDQSRSAAGRSPAARGEPRGSGATRSGSARASPPPRR